MQKLVLLWIFFFGIIVGGMAQSAKPLRIEVSARKAEAVYTIPLESRHLVIIQHQHKRTVEGEHWLMKVYNETFVITASKNMYLPKTFTLFDHKIQGDSILYLCFAEKNGNNSSLMLYRFNLKTNNITHTYIKGSRKAILKSFEVVGNSIYLFGERMEGLQSQLVNSTLPFNIKIIAPVYPNYSYILASYALTASNKVIVIVDVSRGAQMGRYYYEYKNSSTNGTKKELQINANINLIDAALIKAQGGSLLLMGTYNNSAQAKSKIDEISKGIFIGKIYDGAFDFFKVYKFSDFTNLVSSLNYRDQLRVKHKAQKGKEVNIKFKLLVHKKALRVANKYILAAETYYPEFHYENNFDSRGYMYQVEVFDGYRTTNCIVASFNDKGRLIWDNFLPVNGIINYNLQENILVFPEADSSIVMAYYARGKIWSKTVDGNKIIFKKTVDRVETMPGENVISEQYGNIEKWYNHYFILSGYQTIIDTKGKKRKVYFFNLISFE